MVERLPACVRTPVSPPRVRWVLWPTVLACLGTTGCATSLREWAHNRFKVGPKYERPPAPVAPAYIESDNHKITCDPAQDCVWWAVFNDPTLNGLIETAYRQNLDLCVAGTRILDARGQRNIAVGNLFPQSQSAMGTYAHGQITENLNVPVPNSVTACHRLWLWSNRARHRFRSFPPWLPTQLSRCRKSSNPNRRRAKLARP